MKKARVVTKAQYAGHVAKQTGRYGAGFALVTLGGLALMSFGICLCLFAVLWLVQWTPLWADILKVDPDINLSPVSAVICVVMTELSCVCIWAGEVTLRKSAEVVLVQPLTRSTAAALPADETLLRAGDIPQQAQETLLRAAQGPVEENGGELLRPTQGGAE